MKSSLLLLAGCFLFGAALASAAPPTVTDLAGQPMDPLATADHRAVVLFFVAADCPISNRYAPEIEKIARRFPGSTFSFWLVYSDRKITARTLQAHGEDYHLSVPALLDRELDLARLAGVTTTPEVAVYVAGEADPWIYRGRIDNRYASFSHVLPAPTVTDLLDTLTALAAGHIPAPRRTEAVGCYLDL
jgi:hypothetical protein